MRAHFTKNEHIFTFKYYLIVILNSWSFKSSILHSNFGSKLKYSTKLGGTRITKEFPHLPIAVLIIIYYDST